MKYILDRTAPRPVYLQLYDQLKSDIVASLYPYGSRLPSKRLISAEAGISVISAEHAYELLCEEGYAEARERSGYYVIYRETDFPLFPALQQPESLSAPPEHFRVDFPFSVISRTMRRVLLDYGDRILVRSPHKGLAELRSTIAAYLGRSCGIYVSPEQIVIGAGAEYLYGLIVQLLGKGHRFALEEPSYEKIRKVYEANGVEYDLLPLGSDGIRSDALEESRAAVLHVTPFHSFPSGVTADASKRREYIRWAERRQGYIIEDNYDSELTVSRKYEDTVFSLSPAGRVIYLNTFSQTIAPAVRVGYMVLPVALLPLFDEKLGFYACTVPVFEQYVLAELLRSGDFERHINRVRREKRKSL